MEYIDKVFEKLKNFRSTMGVPVTQDSIKYIWGKRYLKSLKEKGFDIPNDIENKYIEEKTNIAEKSVSILKVFNWVKFIGISGSVAAGFAREDDDIDIYVVVKDNTAWLYRGIVVLRNLFHNRVRAKRHRVVKNKLCVNLINEERGVQFTNDMFNFHELMYLIPIYNEEYIKYIIVRRKGEYSSFEEFCESNKNSLIYKYLVGEPIVKLYSEELKIREGVGNYVSINYYKKKLPEIINKKIRIR